MLTGIVALFSPLRSSILPNHLRLLQYSSLQAVDFEWTSLLSSALLSSVRLFQLFCHLGNHVPLLLKASHTFVCEGLCTCSVVRVHGAVCPGLNLIVFAESVHLYLFRSPPRVEIRTNPCLRLAQAGIYGVCLTIVRYSLCGDFEAATAML